MKMNIVLRCNCHLLRKLWKSMLFYLLLSYMKFICKIWIWKFSSFKNGFTIIPILVGSLTPEKEAIYGRLLAPYLADPQNLFVISSDFCHWGQRFRYTYYDRSSGPIYRSIQTLDKMVNTTNWIGIKLIELSLMSFFPIFTGHGYYRNIESYFVHGIPKKIWEYNLWTPSNWGIVASEWSTFYCCTE